DRSDQRHAVIRLYLAGANTDGDAAIGGVRSIPRLIPSATLWPPCPRAGPDGTLPATACRLGSDPGDQQRRSASQRFRERGRQRQPHAGRTQTFHRRLRTPPEPRSDPPDVWLPTELPPTART